MKHSMLILLAAGMFAFTGTSDLSAQEVAVDTTADADAETATEAIDDTPSDVQVVDASIVNPGAVEPMALNVEFSGSADEWAGALTIPGMEMRIDLDDMLLTDDLFSFSLVNSGGQEIECSLFRLDDDSFRGECTDGGGEGAEMTIGAFEK